jgi:hypothetical protein
MTERDLTRVARDMRQAIVNGVGAGDPTDLYFAICAPLQGWLAFMGLDLELVEADFGWTNHCWLALPDGRILDPTADQFARHGVELPAVYLGPLPDAYRRWMREADA